jgi:hypothetical protein
MKRIPKVITYRPMDETKIQNMVNYLDNHNWASLDVDNVDDANDTFTKTINYALDRFAAKKTLRIPYRNIIRDHWMTPALLKSSMTREKMFRKSLGKPKDSKAYNNFIKYRNLYNKLKKLHKQNNYATELTKFKNDTRRTWKILKEVIGKQNDKSNISEVFRSGNDIIKDPKTISNMFCKYFSEIGPKFAERIPAPAKSYDHYMKRAISNQSLFRSPTDPIEISRIIMSLKPKNSSGHDGISSKLLKTLNQSICIPYVQ